MGRRGFEGRLRARGPRTYLGQEEGRGNSFGWQTKGGEWRGSREGNGGDVGRIKRRFQRRLRSRLKGKGGISWEGRVARVEERQRRSRGQTMGRRGHTGLREGGGSRRDFRGIYGQTKGAGWGSNEGKAEKRENREQTLGGGRGHID